MFILTSSSSCLQKTFFFCFSSQFHYVLSVECSWIVTDRINGLQVMLSCRTLYHNSKSDYTHDIINWLNLYREYPPGNTGVEISSEIYWWTSKIPVYRDMFIIDCFELVEFAVDCVMCPELWTSFLPVILWLVFQTGLDEFGACDSSCAHDGTFESKNYVDHFCLVQKTLLFKPVLLWAQNMSVTMESGWQSITLIHFAYQLSCR